MSPSKCPVCGWALDEKALKVEVEGRETAVCCQDCATTLKASPKKYISIGGLA